MTSPKNTDATQYDRRLLRVRVAPCPGCHRYMTSVEPKYSPVDRFECPECGTITGRPARAED